MSGSWLQGPRELKVETWRGPLVGRLQGHRDDHFVSRAHPPISERGIAAPRAVVVVVVTFIVVLINAVVVDAVVDDVVDAVLVFRGPIEHDLSGICGIF